MRKFLAKIILPIFLFLPTVSFALELQYPEIGPEGQKITIVLGMDLNKLIAWFYYFIVGIAGISAFVMLVWGGFTWLTSAGNPTKISDARDRITSTFLGLIIILSSLMTLSANKSNFRSFCNKRS